MMKSLNTTLRNRLRRWLGFTEIETSLLNIKERYSRMERHWERATAEIQDISCSKGNTRIVIASNLAGGFCRWYEIKFNDHRELMNFCEVLKHREVSSQEPFIDAPRAFDDPIDTERKRRNLPARRR